MIVEHQLSMYGNSDTEYMIDVDVLLPIPKGIMITVKCNVNTTFAEIKDKVWQKLTNMMDLGPKDKFSFEGINEMAMIERYEDDKVTLRESKLFSYLLKLVEMRVVDVDKKFIANLSMLAGRNVCMEVSKFPTLEVEEFHELMEETSLNYNQLRATYDYKTLLTIKYPPSTITIEGSILEFEQQYNTMQYTLYIDSNYRLIPNSSSGNWERVENFIVPFRASVQLVLDVLVEIEKLVTTNNYLLKVSGREDYFFEENRVLPEYKYIQECIRDSTMPTLVLVTYEDLIKSNQMTVKPSANAKEAIAQHEIFPMSPLHFSGNSGDKLSSDVREKFSICVKTLSDINLDRGHLVCVYVAMYSGNNRLEQLKTSEKPITSVVEWDETLAFKLDIADLPRNAKLCFSIQKRRKIKTTEDTKKKSKQNNNNDDTVITSKSAKYWLNMTVFDFKGTLRHGKREHHVWNDISSDSGFHSDGTCFPYTLSDTPIFTIELPERKNPIVFYPLATARVLALQDTGPDSLSEAEKLELGEEDRARLELLLSHAYGTYQVTEDDNAFLWKHRVHCREYPQSLPKLVTSQSLDSLEKSTQLYTLLLDWPPVSVVTALQLFLNINDPAVREFAVYSLDRLLSDDMVRLYTLQLVECLKFDLYLDCALTRFLLKRALLSNTLGHYFYWHLKSQVDSAEFGPQFALIIEFYLRCCGDYIEELNKISNVMSKIGYVYEKVKRLSSDEIKATLNAPAINKAFCGFQCLTDPQLRTKDILVEKTKIFDSSMRPILLKFSNQDPTYKEDFGMLYKEGDDLRQDQLVLQFINLMNRIWMKEGLDMKILEYSAVYTRNRRGVMEFIKDAENLAGLIKRYKAYAAFETWLREKNPHPVDLEEARLNFTRSCCGYTLIHYVLGISDRHPSNIMLREDGKLVHVDFGHILGNTKQKFGVNREPSPFIFLKEWVDFISCSGSEDFKKFEQLFARAYLVLRKHSEEFLTLWHMMLTAGLKEVNKAAHLDHLTNAMCIGRTDDEAERQILHLLHESIRKTRIQQAHWLVHILAHY